MALSKLYGRQTTIAGNNAATPNATIKTSNLVAGNGGRNVVNPSVGSGPNLTANSNMKLGKINGIQMTAASSNPSNGGQASDNSLDSAYSTDGSVQSQSSPLDDELAKLAREGNYKAYLNKTIQNANVSRLAQKYLENSLKQHGIETQGAGTIANTQLSNAYLNANAQAQSDFYNTERNITSEANTRADNANKENLNEWSQLLATASQNGNLDEAYQQILDNNPDMDESTKDKLSQYYAAYDNKTSESSSKVSTYQNYMSAANGSGNLDAWYQENVLNNADHSDNEKQELARYYSAIKSSTTSENWLANNADNVSGQYTSDELTNRNLGNGKTGSDISDEIDAMTSYVTSNKPNQPVMFQLISKRNGITAYVYYDPTSGAYYYVDQSVAESFDGKKMNADRSNIGDGFANGRNGVSEKQEQEKHSEINPKQATSLGFPEKNAYLRDGTTHKYGGYTYVWNSSRGLWVRQD